MYIYIYIYIFKNIINIQFKNKKYLNAYRCILYICMHIKLIIISIHLQFPFIAFTLLFIGMSDKLSQIYFY